MSQRDILAPSVFSSPTLDEEGEIIDFKWFSLKTISSQNSIDLACRAGRLDTMATMNNNNAGHIDKYGFTPLHQACLRKSIEIIQKLFQFPDVTVYVEDKLNKSTPLHLACTGIATEPVIASVLNRSPPLDRRSRLRDRDKNGRTPFLLACKQADLKILGLLLSAGSDITAKDEKDNCALHVACKAGRHVNIIEFLATKLMEHGNPSPWLDCNKEGHTSLHLAVMGGRSDVVERLLKFNPDVNVTDNKKRTALHIACCMTNHRIIHMLLKAQANVEAKDESGRTPMHEACQRGNPKIILLMVDYGSQLDTEDDKGLKPSTYLSGGVYSEITGSLKGIYLPNAEPFPLTSSISLFLLLFSSLMWYVDIALDIFTLHVYYTRGQNKYFAMALFFVVSPYLLQVVLSRRKTAKEILASIFASSVLMETKRSLDSKQETTALILLKLLEGVVEACPSSLLQLYVLIRSAIDGVDHGGFLSTYQDIIIFISILSSISVTSFSLSKYLTSFEQKRVITEVITLDDHPDFQVQSIQESYNYIFKSVAALMSIYDRSKVLLLFYHISEEAFRLLSVCCLFLALRAYGLIFIALSLVLRGVLVFVVFEAENYRKIFSAKRILRIILSLETDCIWPNVTASHEKLSFLRLTFLLAFLTLMEASFFYALLLVQVYTTNASGVVLRNIGIVLAVTWVSKSWFFLLTYFKLESYALLPSSTTTQVIPVTPESQSSTLLVGRTQRVAKLQPAFVVETNAEILKRILTSSPQALRSLVDVDGRSTLVIAAAHGNECAMDMLLKAGSNVNHRCKNGTTALHVCCRMGRDDLAKTLVENYANVNALDENQNTPLHYAAAYELQLPRERLAVLLMKYGADVAAKNQDHKTADDVARDMNYGPLSPLFAPSQEAIAGGGLEDKASRVQPPDTAARPVDKLHIAAATGNVAVLRSLLATRRSYVDLLDDRGRSALMLSAERGHIKACKLLLEYRIDLRIYCQDGLRALHYASLAGHSDIVSLLIKCYKKQNLPLNDVDKFGKNVLHHVAELSLSCVDFKQAHANIVIMLVEKGLWVNISDNNGNTPFYLACRAGNLLLVSTLLELGADTTVVNMEGYTPLDIACVKGHVEVVCRLLRSAVVQSDNNIHEEYHKDGKDEVHLLALSMYEKVVEHLLINKGKIEGYVMQETLDQLLQLVYCSCNIEILYLLSYNNVVDLETLFKGGNHALHLASESGNWDIVKILLESMKGDKSNFNLRQLIFVQNDDGRTPLHMACKAGNHIVAKLLLESGEDKVHSIEIPDKDGNTAAHFACKSGNIDLVQLLIDHRADMLAVNKDGNKPTAFLTGEAYSKITGAVRGKYLPSAEAQWMDNDSILLLVCHIVVYYLDTALDLFALSVYAKREQYRYFALQLSFVFVPYLLNVLSYRKASVWDFTTSLLSLSFVVESVNSFRNRLETDRFVLLMLLEIVESSPSALLQLFILVRAAIDNNAEVLPTVADKVIFFSVFISAFRTAIWLQKYLSNASKDKYITAYSLFHLEIMSFIRLLVHISEGIFRLLSVCCLFLALRAYGLIFIALSLVLRGVLVFVVFEAENYRKIFSASRVLRIMLSLETDFIWASDTNLTKSLQVLTSVEGALYLLLFWFTRIYTSLAAVEEIFYKIVCTILVSFALKVLFYALSYGNIVVELYSPVSREETIDQINDAIASEVSEVGVFAYEHKE